MPFKYMMDILRGRETRLDRIERRLGRIESVLSGCSVPRQTRTVQKREKREAPEVGKIKVRRPARKTGSGDRRIQRARTVHGPDGWHFKESDQKEIDLRFKEFTNNWLIEFDCPHCGKSSSRGVNHHWTEFEDDHTNYQVQLKCRKCGWESDIINIRGYK